MTRQQQLAHQMRARLIGALASCTCVYPLEKSPTSTKHALTCSAHRLLCGPSELAQLGVGVEWRQDGGGVRGNCLACGAVVEAPSMEAFTQRMAVEHRHEGASS